MPKVLICTVGGQPQPVVNAVRENAPLDRVYFLCSVGSAKNASDRTLTTTTVQETPGHCPHCKKDFISKKKFRPITETAELAERDYTIEGVADPDDLLQVLTACGRIEADIQARWPRGGVEVIANYTGGTKTMSLGLGFYALRRGDGWELQLNRGVPGGRQNLIRIETGDQSLFQDTSRLIAETALERALALEERYDYEGAVIVLSGTLSRHRLRGEDQNLLLTAQLRVQVLAARERLDYQEAWQLSRQNSELAARFAARFHLLIRIVSALASTEPWPDQAMSGLELVDDLRENATRAASRGRYDDAVGRLYRATELLAQLRLRRLFAIRTDQVDLADERLSAKARARLATVGLAGSESSEETVASAISQGQSTDSQRVKIGLIQAYQLLADLGDALGRYYLAHKGTLLSVIKKRNFSLFAHGLEPIDQATWSRLERRWSPWLDGAQEIL